MCVLFDINVIIKQWEYWDPDQHGSESGQVCALGLRTQQYSEARALHLVTFMWQPLLAARTR